MYPSAPAIPIDHGIKTTNKYQYIHSSKTRAHATTKCTVHGKKKSGVTVTSSTPNPAPYICCPEICNRCSRNNISLTSLQKDVHCRSIQKDCSEIAQWEKDTGETSPELPRSLSTSRKTTNLCSSTKITVMESSFQQNKTKVLDRLVNNYSITKTSSTTSGSTSTRTDQFSNRSIINHNNNS